MGPLFPLYSWKALFSQVIHGWVLSGKKMLTFALIWQEMLLLLYGHKTSFLARCIHPGLWDRHISPVLVLLSVQCSLKRSVQLFSEGKGARSSAKSAHSAPPEASPQPSASQNHVSSHQFTSSPVQQCTRCTAVYKFCPAIQSALLCRSNALPYIQRTIHAYIQWKVGTGARSSKLAMMTHPWWGREWGPWWEWEQGPGWGWE